MSVARTVVAVAIALIALPVRAGLFDDDEARRRVDELRAQVDSMQRALDVRLGTIESQAADRHALVDLSTTIDALRQDIAKLRGQVEVLSNQVEQSDRREKDLYADLDSRLRKFEQAKVSEAERPPPDDRTATAPPPDNAAAEAKAYESALNQYKAGGYQAAIREFQAFIGAYPGSQLAPNAQYWTGNAFYALKDYKSAIGALQRVVSTWPDNARASDAMLNIASSQAELGDTRAERTTLREILDRYPRSPAADTARQRLARRPAQAAR